MVGAATHTVSAASSAMWAETVLRQQFDSGERHATLESQRLIYTRRSRVSLKEKGIGMFKTSQASDVQRPDTTSCNSGATRNLREFLLHLNCTQISVNCLF